jgi:hypothetical protein
MHRLCEMIELNCGKASGENRQSWVFVFYVLSVGIVKFQIVFDF